jgi:hypothetical protein
MANSWIVSQIGARQHYAVPRGFHRRRQLRLFYTDAWWRYPTSIFSHAPTPVRAFVGRKHPELPRDKVVSFNFGAVSAWYKMRSAEDSVAGRAGEYLRIGRWFAAAVAADLENRDLDPATDVFFGFNTACLETFNLLSSRRILTVCDQIDPGLIEENLVVEEAEKWPGWLTPKSAGRVPPEYWARMRAEWAAATLVMVNSEWSRAALEGQGVPASKLFVAPINFEPTDPIPADKPPSQDALTVLWLGSVSLRKGIQYLLHAARLLEHNSWIDFVVAGGLQISESAAASAPKNVRFLGPISRNQTQSLYRAADLFVLPTLSDGFAISQLEAMSNGLPVITTDRCGQVVTHGVDGLIVPPCDGVALADAIANLASDRRKLHGMRQAALAKSQSFRLPMQAAQIDARVEACRQAMARTRI